MFVVRRHCRPLRGLTSKINPDPRVARFALTLGYFIARFQREGTPSLTVGLLHHHHPRSDTFPSPSLSADTECLSPSTQARARLSKSDRRTPATDAYSPSG